MSEDFSNSQDGIFATMLKQMATKELDEASRKSKKDTSDKGQKPSQTEVDLDIYAEERIIRHLYHNAWIGKEVTFHFQRAERHHPATAIYEGGLDSPDEGIVIYSEGGSQKTVRIESIQSVEYSAEKGVTFWIHLDNVRQNRFDLKRRKPSIDFDETQPTIEDWYWAKLYSRFMHELVEVTFTDSPDARIGWFEKTPGSDNTIKLGELMSTRTLTILCGTLKNIRTITAIPPSNFDFEREIASPPIDINPKEMGFVDTEMTWKTFSSIPVDVRIKETHPWTQNNPISTRLTGYIHNLTIPKGPKSGVFETSIEDEKLMIPVEAILTIKVDTDTGPGTTIQALPLSGRSPRTRSQSAHSRRSRSARSWHSRKATSVKSRTSFRSMRHKDFDSSDDETITGAMTSSRKGTDDEEDPIQDIPQQNLTIRNAREEWEEMIQKDPSALFAPKEQRSQDFERIFKNFPPRVQKILNKVSKTMDSEWRKNRRDPISLVAMRDKVRKVWDKYDRESHDSDSSSSSSDEESSGKEDEVEQTPKGTYNWSQLLLGTGPDHIPMETLTSNRLQWLKYIPTPHEKTYHKARHLLKEKWLRRGKSPLKFRTARKIILKLIKEQDAPLENPNTTCKDSQDETGSRWNEEAESRVSRKTVKEPRSNPPISVSGRIWKDMTTHSDILEQVTAKGYSKYLTQIFEAEELFHKEQVPFMARILTQNFVNTIREKSLKGDPSDCEPAIMDLVMETQAVLAGMPQPEWSRTELDNMIQDIASSVKCPAELSGLARSMQRAIRAHELHIDTFQAWMWVEQIEEARGTYKDRSVLTNAALQTANLLQPFQNVDDTNIGLTEYVIGLRKEKEKSQGPYLRQVKQIQRIFGNLREENKLDFVTVNRIRKLLMTTVDNPEDPPTQEQIQETLLILESILLQKEPSGLKLPTIMSITDVINNMRDEQRRGQKPPETVKHLYGAELADAFRRWLDAQDDNDAKSTPEYLELNQRVTTHPRVKEILRHKIQFESPRAMIAAVAVNPAYWKQMNVYHMMKFCEQLLETCFDYSIPEKLDISWHHLRFHEAIQKVCNDIGWSPDPEGLDWLRFPSKFETRTQAEQISIQEFLLDISENKDPLYKRYLEAQTTKDYTRFATSYLSWRKRAVGTATRSPNTSTEAWEASFHPYLTMWENNGLSPNRLRLTHNGHGPSKDRDWKRMWNQLVSAPTAQVMTDGPSKSGTGPLPSSLDMASAIYLTPEDWDVIPEPKPREQEWGPDDMEEDLDDSRTTQLREEAKHFMNSLTEQVRQKLTPLYCRWKSGFPTQPFDQMVVQSAGDIIECLQDEKLKKRLLEPQFQLFGLDGIPKADSEWYRLFCIHSTLNPPTDHPEEKEQHRLMGNLRDDFGFQQLNTISAEDFLPEGRFAAYYIGRQLYVPHAIIDALQLKRIVLVNGDLLQIIWRKLYAARLEANEKTKSPNWHYQVPSHLQNPWIRLLSDMTVAKSFQYDNIDIVQAVEAQRKFEKTLSTAQVEDLYSAFIRPLERLFTMDMPLNVRLMRALHNKDGTDDMVRYICRLVGWNEFPLNMTTSSLIEQLSMIRATSSTQLTRYMFSDQPHVYFQRIQLMASKHNNYRGGSTREALKRRSIPAPEGWYLPTRREFQERIRNNLEQLKEDKEQLHNYVTEAKRLKEMAKKDSNEFKRVQPLLADIQRNITAKSSWITQLWKLVQKDIETRNLMEIRYDIPTKDPENLRKTPRPLLHVMQQRLHDEAMKSKEQFRVLKQRLRDAGPDPRDINALQLSSTFETLIQIEENYRQVRSDLILIERCAKWNELPGDSSGDDEPVRSEEPRAKTPTRSRPNTPSAPAPQPRSARKEATKQVSPQKRDEVGEKEFDDLSTFMPKKKRALFAQPPPVPLMGWALPMKIAESAKDIQWWSTTDQGTTGPRWIYTACSASQAVYCAPYVTKDNEECTSIESDKISFQMETPTGQEFLQIWVKTDQVAGPTLTITSHQMKRRPDGTGDPNHAMNKHSLDIPVLFAKDIADILSEMTDMKLGPLSAEGLTDPPQVWARDIRESPHVTITITIVSHTRYGVRYRDVKIARKGSDERSARVNIPWIHLGRTSKFFAAMARELQRQHRNFIKASVAAGGLVI